MAKLLLTIAALLFSAQSFAGSEAELEIRKALQIPADMRVENFLEALEFQVYAMCFYGPVEKITDDCLQYQDQKARRCVETAGKYDCGYFLPGDKKNSLVYSLEIRLARQTYAPEQERLKKLIADVKEIEALKLKK